MEERLVPSLFTLHKEPTWQNKKRTNPILRFAQREKKVNNIATDSLINDQIDVLF